MEQLVQQFDTIQIEKPEDILLKIIDYDFNKLKDLYINNETFICIEPEPIHEYFLTPENCKIMYNYLSNNQNGYNLFKQKLLKEPVVQRFNIHINDVDIQSYVDYYLNSLVIE